MNTERSNGIAKKAEEMIPTKIWGILIAETDLKMISFQLLLDDSLRLAKQQDVYMIFLFLSNQRR